MFQIASAREAVELIKDGDCIGINSFLVLSNPEQLHNALRQRFEEDGHPCGLKLFCAAGFGGWSEQRFADQYIALGAVREIVAGHYGSMPVAMRMAMEGKIEAYNLPLGPLSQSLRAAASGQDGFLSEVGLNIFADPRVGKTGLNSSSNKELATIVTVNGKERIFYKAPKLDVAFIKGTSVDPNGNITFEKEYLTVDALAMAQATKANGGKVLVQVEQVTHVFARPRNVIVPGMLVDVVVVCPSTSAGYSGALSGDIHVPPSQMSYYMGTLEPSKKSKGLDQSAKIIGERASAELAPGQIINIGIGIPELVGKYAAKNNTLKDLVATVESGGIGGLPAPGIAFGATIGADMISDMASQFDYYDGGGLDICFMGGLEADMQGNVNAHDLEGSYPGIGGFADITFSTKTIVFCMTFTAKGLVAQRKDGKVSIVQEGSVPKFRKRVRALSFSAKNALARNQRVLYVTERCVFELAEDGLRLKEVYDGIDPRVDIYPKLE
ncbi:MAG: propionate CoA-transferase [Clostridiales bacterium]|nr:propionate CoA-transferase [Clostridiales bacterium]MDR2750745.1 propionate CoA-transferase [Clostridiales bacterium]